MPTEMNSSGFTIPTQVCLQCVPLVLHCIASVSESKKTFSKFSDKRSLVIYVNDIVGY